MGNAIKGFLGSGAFLTIVILFVLVITYSWLSVPLTFNQCVNGSSEEEHKVLSGEATKLVYPANYKVQEEQMRANLNHYVQLCRAEVGGWKYKLLKGSPIKPWEAAIRFSTALGFEGYFLFYLNPNYVLPSNYDECVERTGTRSGQPCSIEFVKKTILKHPEIYPVELYKDIAFLESKTDKKIENFSYSIQSGGALFHYTYYDTEITFHSSEYYPCDEEGKCRGSNFTCNPYGKWCYRKCRADADCIEGMRCGLMLNAGHCVF